ncbi:MAG: extracellular solute-binding protein [Clostridia bacterium]|nr:extracellular solute-binding protein [Clostridia bacterium]
MFNKLRIALICMLAVVVAVSFIGCSGSKDKDKDDSSSGKANPVPEDLAGSIIISSYNAKYTAEDPYGEDENNDNDNDLFMFTQSFALQYPSVDVQLDATLGYEDYFNTLDSRIESGDIGDVVLISSDKLPEYVEKGWIVDISNEANGVTDFTDSNFGKLYPSKVYMQAAYDASMYDGRLYMCPVEYLNQVVILNLDLLKAAGIENPVPSDSWTWDDLLSYAGALRESGVETPILMNYNDYSIWGAFAQSFGGSIYNDVSFADKTVELNLTDPNVIEGLKYFADNFLRTGYVDNKQTKDVRGEDLSKYGIIVADHSDVVKWQNYLAVDTEDDPDAVVFDWEFAHFPGFASEDGTVYKNIGVKTLGFAVINREVVRSSDYTTDFDKSDEELEEEAKEIANTIKLSKSLALYAMVKEAAVAYAGDVGYKVPAVVSANSMKFWREYPLSGKNTSVFSLYSENDYPAVLTSFMSWNASLEVKDAIADVFDAYTQDSTMTHIDELLQTIQDAANANW